MKFLGKISGMMLIAFIAGGSIFAQSTPQSRLDVGKNVKRNVATGFFSNVPNKLNFDSKAEYTQFYRNLLLNNKTNNPKNLEPVASAEVKSASKVVESNLEKVKFGNIFPNPADAYANLEYEIKDDFTEGRVTVMNMVGSSVLEYSLASGNSMGNTKLRMNTSGLVSGIYMVQCVVDGKKMSTKKLLVERN